MNDALAGRDHSLHATWPLHRRQLLQLLGWYAVITATWIGIGKLITGPLKDSAVTRADLRAAKWFVAHRTPTWDRLTVWGSGLAETLTKIIVTTILALVLLKVWKRWFEPLILAVTLIVEASAFIVVTTVVNRPRPPVARLDNSPVGSSFPSGHVAAAAAYFAITVIIFWHTRKVWARALAVIVTSLIPLIVALSRMYRGMHFLSDVVGGALLGATAVTVTVLVMRRAPEAQQAISEADTSAFERGASTRADTDGSSVAPTARPCRVLASMPPRAVSSQRSR